MLRYHTEGLKKSVSPISQMAFPSSALEQRGPGALAGHLHQCFSLCGSGLVFKISNPMQANTFIKYSKDELLEKPIKYRA